MASTQQPGDVPDVSVSGSQGIQVGTGNTMYASWGPKPPLVPAAMRDLNPHRAVARLRQLSHDDLVDFFARASPDDVREIIAAFLEVDLGRVAAALADISQRKLTELINGNGKYHMLSILVDLPEAAKEIDRKARDLWWADAEPLEVFQEGYVRKYNNGHD